MRFSIRPNSDLPARKYVRLAHAAEAAAGTFGRAVLSHFRRE